MFWVGDGDFWGVGLLDAIGVFFGQDLGARFGRKLGHERRDGTDGYTP